MATNWIIVLRVPLDKSKDGCACKPHPQLQLSGEGRLNAEVGAEVSGAVPNSSALPNQRGLMHQIALRPTLGTLVAIGLGVALRE
jgi:hypothetical protein